jgi:hypothetical protein
MNKVHQIDDCSALHFAALLARGSDERVRRTDRLAVVGATRGSCNGQATALAGRVRQIASPGRVSMNSLSTSSRYSTATKPDVRF